MTVPRSTDAPRRRCTPCGIRTRSAVPRQGTAAEYVRPDVAGERKVEKRDVCGENIESVRCRRCGAVDRVELVGRPGAGV